MNAFIVGSLWSWAESIIQREWEGSTGDGSVEEPTKVVTEEGSEEPISVTGSTGDAQEQGTVEDIVETGPVQLDLQAKGNGEPGALSPGVASQTSLGGLSRGVE